MTELVLKFENVESMEAVALELTEEFVEGVTGTDINKVERVGDTMFFTTVVPEPEVVPTEVTPVEVLTPITELPNNGSVSGVPLPQVPAEGSDVTDEPVLEVPPMTSDEVPPVLTEDIVDPEAQVIATLEEADRALEKSQEQSEASERSVENAIGQLSGDNRKRKNR